MTWTTLAFEGVAPDEVTEDLLVELMDVCEDHGLDVDGVSIDWRDSRGEPGE